MCTQNDKIVFAVITVDNGIIMPQDSCRSGKQGETNNLSMRCTRQCTFAYIFSHPSVLVHVIFQSILIPRHCCCHCKLSTCVMRHNYVSVNLQSSQFPWQHPSARGEPLQLNESENGGSLQAYSCPLSERNLCDQDIYCGCHMRMIFPTFAQFWRTLSLQQCPTVQLASLVGYSCFC